MTTFRVLALTLLTSFAMTVPADAVNVSYMAGIVKNNTNIYIAYQYKLNNGPWVTVSLYPGQQHVYSFRYPHGNQTVYLRFDNRLGDNQTTFTNTTLAMHGTNLPINGWRQNFIRVNDGRTLMLAR